MSETLYPAGRPDDPPSFDLDIELAPVEPSPELLALRERARQTDYFKLACFWMQRGFKVVPGDLNKVPLTSFGVVADGRAQSEEDHLQHAVNHPDAIPLLLTGCGTYPLAVIDVDDPRFLQWAQDTFGVTPWLVGTGREGGGFHLVYRVPAGQTIPQANGIIGPPESVKTWSHTLADGKVVKDSKWGRTPIDLKSHHSYVVAPGSLHKSGRRYLPQNGLRLKDITPEWIEANVPFISVEAIDRLKAESVQRKHEKQREIQMVDPRTKERLTPAGDIVFTTTDDEPFIAWCEENPGEVNLALWWGLASNLAALHGASGRLEFHRLSALRVDVYDAAECEQTWQKVCSTLQGKPVTYRNLVTNGYWGPVPPPETGKSPAQFILTRNTVPLTGVFTLDGEAVALGPVEPTPAKVLTPEEQLEVRRARAREIRALEAAEDAAKPKRYAPRHLHEKRQPEEIPEKLLLMSRKAMKLARKWARRIRPVWRAAGMRRKDGCGSFHQALTHTADWSIRPHTRYCGGVNCLRCGPLALARKAAALLDMPILGSDGLMVSPGLRYRTLFVHWLPTKGVGAWKKRYERAITEIEEMSQLGLREEQGDLSKTQLRQHDLSDEFYIPKGLTSVDRGDPKLSNAYVVFRLHGSDEAVILTTLNLDGVNLGDVGCDIEKLVFDLIAATYVPVEEDAILDLVGQSPEEAEVVVKVDARKKMTSSRNLCLNPDSLWRRANPASCVVEEPKICSPERAVELSKPGGFRASVSGWDRIRHKDGRITHLAASAAIPAPETEYERRRVLLILREGKIPEPMKDETDYAAQQAAVAELG